MTEYASVGYRGISSNNMMTIALPRVERLATGFKVEGWPNPYSVSPNEEEAWKRVGNAIAVALKLREENDQEKAKVDAVSKWLDSHRSGSLHDAAKDLLELAKGLGV